MAGIRWRAWDCRKIWGAKARRAFPRLVLTLGERVVWILRLVKIGAECEGQALDVMEINRPDCVAWIICLVYQQCIAQRRATYRQKIGNFEELCTDQEWVAFWLYM